MPRAIPPGDFPAQDLSSAVLREIEERGVEGVRVARIAERMGLSMGTLYRRWGGREMCLEQAWRHVMAMLDQEVGRSILLLRPQWHAFDDVWESLRRALPEHFDAFIELHSARGRWMRGRQESDAVVLPTLALYVDLAQHLGHVRLGPTHTLAAMIWWTIAGTLTGPFKFDANQEQWCLEALKRMLFTPKALELDAMNFDIDVEYPDERPDADEKETSSTDAW
jgi:AcrR family transcriptional regulator